jgi:hypothetical protein
VFVKARESVLEGGPTGEPEAGQVVKLLPPEKPDLPETGQAKTDQDTGFDKPPAECVTDAAGGCKIAISREDGPYYRLPDVPTASRTNYRVDVDVPNRTGGVVETTQKPVPADALSSLPKGVDVASGAFRIGDRTFLRLSVAAAAKVNVSLRESFDRPGASYQDDYCREKQPGPSFGARPVSSSAVNSELPGAAVKLLAAGEARR